MTPARAKELLPIIQAFAEGVKIQCQTSCGDWVDAGDDILIVQHAQFRIKPEPREFYIERRIETDNIVGCYREWRQPVQGFEIIHVREVL